MTKEARTTKSEFPGGHSIPPQACGRARGCNETYVLPVSLQIPSFGAWLLCHAKGGLGPLPDPGRPESKPLRTPAVPRGGKPALHESLWEPGAPEAPRWVCSCYLEFRIRVSFVIRHSSFGFGLAPT